MIKRTTELAEIIINRPFALVTYTGDRCDFSII